MDRIPGRIGGVVAALALALACAACGPPPVDEVAWVMNYTMDELVNAGIHTYPDTFTCASHQFRSNGGGGISIPTVVSLDPINHVEVITWAVALDVTGDTIFATGNSKNPAIQCTVTAQWSFDGNGFFGDGKILVCPTNPSDFQCQVNNVSISCADMQRALATRGCQ